MSRFLDPATLANIKDLRLVAKTAVSGFLSGQQTNRQAGAGIEFVQHRSYQPGDDPKLVDWRMYARSDRYFVRESEHERDVTVRFILDASRSMAHRDGGVTKLDYARMLIASLCYLVDRQGERVRLHVVNDENEHHAPPRRRALHHILHQLETAAASGTWPAWSRLERQFSTVRGRELVVVVSDLHEREGEIRTAIASLRARHEVLMLHLMARDELELDYDGDVELRDLETGETVRVDARTARAAYLERLRHELESCKQSMLGMSVSYQMLPTDQPLDLALRRYLLERQRIR